MQCHLNNFVQKVIFQQHGNLKHIVKIMKEWLGDKSFVLMMLMPVQNPDLNPIKNLSSIVKRQYRTTPNLYELWQRIQKEWNNIPKEIIQYLVLQVFYETKDLSKAAKLNTCTS